MLPLRIQVPRAPPWTYAVRYEKGRAWESEFSTRTTGDADVDTGFGVRHPSSVPENHIIVGKLFSISQTQFPRAGKMGLLITLLKAWSWWHR